MNNRHFSTFSYAWRWLRFMAAAGTRHDIHSPFLFRFVEEVIVSSDRVPGSGPFEEIRHKLRHSHEIIQKTDYGAGAGELPSLRYPVRIGKVARTSLSSRHNASRLYRLVRFNRGSRILEIGTSLGITTAYLASANPGARVITLEGCPELSRLAKKNFSDLGIRNIQLVNGRFEDTLEQALESLSSVDVVFIDGNHRKKAVLDYFSQCLNYSNNDTVLVVDDIHSSPEMEQAWDIIQSHEKVRVTLDLFFSGWVLLRKESSREHFRLRYF